MESQNRPKLDYLQKTQIYGTYQGDGEWERISNVEKWFIVVYSV